MASRYSQKVIKGTTSYVADNINGVRIESAQSSTVFYSKPIFVWGKMAKIIGSVYVGINSTADKNFIEGTVIWSVGFEPADIAMKDVAELIKSPEIRSEFSSTASAQGFEQESEYSTANGGIEMMNLESFQFENSIEKKEERFGVTQTINPELAIKEIIEKIGEELVSLAKDCIADVEGAMKVLAGTIEAFAPTPTKDRRKSYTVSKSNEAVDSNDLEKFINSLGYKVLDVVQEYSRHADEGFVYSVTISVDDDIDAQELSEKVMNHFWSFISYEIRNSIDDDGRDTLIFDFLQESLDEESDQEDY